MKRFIITEDERNQILGLYKSKKLIIEADGPGKKYNAEVRNPPMSYFHTRFDGNQKDIYLSGSTFFFETLRKADNVTKKIPKEDTVSLNIWNTILKDHQVFAANIIFYYENNNEWIEEIEFRDKRSSEGTPAEIPVEELFPGKETGIPKETDTSYFFDNNQWVLTQRAKNNLDSIINPLINEKGTMEACIDLIEIESSASRYRNTDLAKDLSFKDLSQKRNDAVKDYIYEKLKAAGFTQWCKGTENIIQNVNGSNGDGSSGPNPPSPTPFIIKGQEKMEPAANDETKRGEFGPPRAKLEEYDDYKYSRPRIVVAYNDKTEPTTEVTKVDPQKQSKLIYEVIFKGNTSIDRRYTKKRIDLGGGDKGVHTTPLKNYTKAVTTNCPVFTK